MIAWVLCLHIYNNICDNCIQVNFTPHRLNAESELHCYRLSQYVKSIEGYAGAHCIKVFREDGKEWNVYEGHP